MQRDRQTFWRFSLRLYSAPRVAASCIALQDRLGVDVNLLLFCCWLGSRGRRLSAKELRAATRGVDSWQREVVQPLRRARRAIGKKEPRLERLRRRVAAAELAAERREQAMLEEGARTLRAARKSTPRAAVTANLAGYLRQAGQTSGRDLGALIDACCGRDAGR